MYNKSPALFGLLLYQPCFFKQLKNLFFGNVLQLAFVVNVDQIDLLVLGHQEGDHPGATGFTFSFGGNRQTNLIDAMAQVNAGIRFFFKGIDQSLKIGF